MSATVRDARYRICDGGNPGWHVVRRYNEHGTRMVELHNPDLAHLALDGRAVTNCAESKLIPVEAATHGTTDAPTAGAANYAAVGASSSRPGGSPITPGAGTAAATVSPAVAAAPHLPGSGLTQGDSDTDVQSLADSGLTGQGPQPSRNPLGGEPSVQRREHLHPTRAPDADESTTRAPHRGARNTDPTTSVEAAESITDLHRRADHDMVLHLLALHGPLTDFDLARHVTALTGHTVVARWRHE